MKRYSILITTNPEEHGEPKVLAGPSNDIPGMRFLEHEYKFGTKQGKIPAGHIISFCDLDHIRTLRKQTPVPQMKAPTIPARV